MSEDKKIAVDHANDRQPNNSHSQKNESEPNLDQPATDVKREEWEPASPPGRCKSCKAPIFWARTQTGAAVPIDPQQRLDGNVVLFGEGGCRVVKAGEGRYVTHFTTCPKASSHRGRKAGG